MYCFTFKQNLFQNDSDNNTGSKFQWSNLSSNLFLTFQSHAWKPKVQPYDVLCIPVPSQRVSVQNDNGSSGGIVALRCHSAQTEECWSRTHSCHPQYKAALGRKISKHNCNITKETNKHHFHNSVDNNLHIILKSIKAYTFNKKQQFIKQQKTYITFEMGS